MGSRESIRVFRCDWEDAERYGYVCEQNSLLGTTKAKFIADQVRTVAGDRPGEGAVQHVVSRCQQPD